MLIVFDSLSFSVPLRSLILLLPLSPVSYRRDEGESGHFGVKQTIFVNYCIKLPISNNACYIAVFTIDYNF